MKISTLQSLQSQCRDIIYDIEQDIILFKQGKRVADTLSDQPTEYLYHNAAARAKKLLKHWVGIQKDIKEQLRHEYDVQRAEKRKQNVEKLVAKIKKSVGEVK